MAHPQTAIARRLSDFRRDLVRQRTQMCNKIRWHVHELDPSLHIPSRGLRRRSDGPRAGPLRWCCVARLARELLARCADLNQQITGLESELRTLVRQTPLSGSRWRTTARRLFVTSTWRWKCV